MFKKNDIVFIDKRQYITYFRSECSFKEAEDAFNEIAKEYSYFIVKAFNKNKNLINLLPVYKDANTVVKHLWLDVPAFLFTKIYRNIINLEN